MWVFEIKLGTSRNLLGLYQLILACMYSVIFYLFRSSTGPLYVFCLSFDDILGTSLKVVNFLLVEIFLLDTLLLFLVLSLNCLFWL